MNVTQNLNLNAAQITNNIVDYVTPTLCFENFSYVIYHEQYIAGVHTMRGIISCNAFYVLC